VLIYLASPYSHPDPLVRLDRFDTVCCVAAKLMRDGMHLYSPIAHTHPIALKGDLPLGWEYWEQYDRKILEACTDLWVVTIDGWKESKGIAAEITIAGEMGLPIKYIEPTW
jgi:hypothetical protein